MLETFYINGHNSWNSWILNSARKHTSPLHNFQFTVYEIFSTNPNSFQLFIYYHSNMQDLKKLHGHVSKAELGFLIKPFKDVEASTVLKRQRPTMITDYLDGISETENIALAIQDNVQFMNWGQDGYPKRFKIIKPTITDIGLCQGFNSILTINKIFFY